MRELMKQHVQAHAKVRELYFSILYHAELEKAGLKKDQVSYLVHGANLPAGGKFSRQQMARAYPDWAFGVKLKPTEGETEGKIVWFENPIPPKEKLHIEDLETPAQRQERLRIKSLGLE